jgi:hypothetical protein
MLDSSALSRVPRRIESNAWRRMRPHDAADVQLAGDHVIIIVRPFAVRAAFGCAFQNEHGSA